MCGTGPRAVNLGSSGWLSVLTATSDGAGIQYEPLPNCQRPGRSCKKARPCPQSKDPRTCAVYVHCPKPRKLQRNLWGCRAGGRHRDPRQICGPRGTERYKLPRAAWRAGQDWKHKYVCRSMTSQETQPASNNSLARHGMLYIVREHLAGSQLPHDDALPRA